MDARELSERRFSRSCLLAAAAAVFAIFTLPAHASRTDAREMIATGTRLPDAVNQLSSLSKGSQDAGIAAEYSLALASTGLVSAALYEMDRAFILDGTDDEVLYAGSTLLAWLGLTQAAGEIQRPAPDWVKGPLPLLSRSRKRSDVSGSMAEFGAALEGATDLMAKSRFITAVDRFSRLTAVYPKEPLAWAGYAIALEKIGAYKTAAKAVAMEAVLSPGMSADESATLFQHRNDLLATPPVTRKKLNESLQGRYTAFIGGSLNGGNGGTSTYSLNAQAGKFLTNSLNLTLDAGYSTLTRFTLGLGERFYYALPVGGPLSLTAGSRVEYDSSPTTGSGNIGLILSPGLSFFIGSGSLDLTVDFGVAGAQSGTQTLEAGYTFYLGSGG